MNDPRFHPYSGNGYRGFMHNMNGPRSMDHPFRPSSPGVSGGRFPRRAIGRRMGHLSPALQVEQDSPSPRSPSSYPGGVATQRPTSNNYYHHSRGMASRSPSRSRGRGRLNGGHSATTVTQVHPAYNKEMAGGSTPKQEAGWCSALTTSTLTLCK